MIQRMFASEEVRQFLNTVPYPEYVPETLPICCDKTIILGWYAPVLIACFPCQIFGDEVEIHAACNRSLRGRKAVFAGVSAIKWIFDKTRFDVVFCEPSSREAAHFAHLCGMRRKGSRLEINRWAA